MIVYIPQLVLPSFLFILYGTCFANSGFTTVEPTICTVIQTSKKLNFTARSDDPTNSRIGHLYYNIPISNKYVKDFSINDYAWLHYSVVATPYTFITTFKNVAAHFQTILQPLSFSTLMFTLLSIAGISIFLTIVSAKTFENLSKIILCLFGGMLDQPPNLQFVMMKSGKFLSLCCIVWSSWGFATWQISGLYKSVIISYLSVSPTPSHPINLEDVIKSGMRIMTMSTINEIDIITKNTLRTYSTFRDIALAETINATKSRQSSNLRKTLDTLYKRVEWFNRTEYDFMLSKIINISSDLPQNFVFLDDQETVERLQVLLTAFSRRWVSQYIPVPIFMARTFWLSPRNFFHPPFVQALSGLYESGLYGRWIVGSKHKAWQGLIELIAIAAFKTHELQADRKVDGNRFYNYLLQQESGSKPVVDVEKVPRDAFRNIGLTCLWLFLLAACVCGVDASTTILTLADINDFPKENSFQKTLEILPNCSVAFYTNKQDEFSQTTNFLWKLFENSHSFHNPHEVHWTAEDEVIPSTNESNNSRPTKDINGDCSVIVYPQNLLDQLKTQQYEIFPQKRQPVFVLLVVENEFIKVPYNNTIQSILFPAIFIEVKLFQSANFVCIPCITSDSLTPINLPTESKTALELKSSWNVLHSNFHRRSILILEKWNISGYGSCMAYSTTNIEPYTCALLIAKGKLNFTVESLAEEKDGFIAKLFRLPLLQGNLVELPLKTYSWLSYGVSVAPYKFVFVFDHVPGHFQTILQPLDFITKILIVISIGSLTLIISLLSSPNHKPSLQVLPEAAFALIGLMLEQPKEKLSAKTLLHLVVWASWLFTTWQIDGLYKSAIFSYLSAQPSPTTPVSLEELINSRMYMSTLSIMADYNETGFEMSIMSNVRDIVVAEMLNISQNYPPSALSINMAYLHDNVKWLNISLPKMISNILNLNDSNDNDTKLPKKFAYIDDQNSVDTFSLLISMLSTKWVSKSIPITIFTDRSFWIVHNNILSPIFKQYISQIFESGLYNWWKEDVQFRWRKGHVKKIFNSTSNASWKKSLGISNIIEDNRFSNYLLWKEYGTSNVFDTMGSVPKIVYRHVLVTSLFIILVACSVFLLECLFAFIKKLTSKKAKKPFVRVKK
ncbi:unnamed protein product [Orchesella dallaii]|uniref:Uncharacterized protein n=1 Tax=Orchesella dallaii TaxID=48710 RepID=A0ABP1Q887_9HEXA